ncbi:Lrp/AsnC family transcriptional regulator [Microbacterium gilvum]|uniref:Lrp/AsnC family transcriptional regulator n=1 Tax=Microbacterium gilvum TaxID=1336204 RepID=A0ABP9A880_9MICO
MTTRSELDALDARILLAMDDEPSASALALARRLGVARNTVHARLQKLERRGALAAPSRRLTPAAFGYHLTAFVDVELSQAQAAAAYAALAAIPEIVEVHSTTGDADLMLKVMARDTRDLRRITELLLAAPGVQRTSTTVSLGEVVAYRVDGVLRRLAEG